MPRPYPPEFRQRAVALVRAGEQAKQVAYELGISAGCLHGWVRQDRIDRGELAGSPPPSPLSFERRASGSESLRLSWPSSARPRSS